MCTYSTMILCEKRRNASQETTINCTNCTNSTVPSRLTRRLQEGFRASAIWLRPQGPREILSYDAGAPEELAPSKKVVTLLVKFFLLSPLKNRLNIQLHFPLFAIHSKRQNLGDPERRIRPIKENRIKLMINVVVSNNSKSVESVHDRLVYLGDTFKG